MQRYLMQTARVTALLVLFLSLACGPSDVDRPEGLRVIMVFDMAGLGDRGFNDMGWAGVQRAVKELGVNASHIQSSEQGDYIPNLSLAAQQADVVVAMGFLMIESLAKVAPLHPETKFIFIDGEVSGDNIASFDFKAEEGAYLAGVLASQVSKTGRVGCVLGMDIPPVEAYEAGFRAGLMAGGARGGRNFVFHSATIGDFNDPSRGKALAQGLIAQGCDVIMQAAGNSGLGVLEAVKESEAVYGIGVDMDQDDVVPGKILTSVLKRIDNAVYQGLSDAVGGRFEAGHSWLGIREGATALTKWRSRFPGQEVGRLVDRAESWVRSGGRVSNNRREIKQGHDEVGW